MKIALLDTVIADLTLDQAKQYARETDKYLWVMDRIFDPINMRVTDARINRVEDRLEEILALANIKG